MIKICWYCGTVGPETTSFVEKCPGCNKMAMIRPSDYNELIKYTESHKPIICDFH